MSENMQKVKYLKFLEVFEDDTKLCKKIPSSEYLKEGAYQIIDQGQNDIAGYTYDSTGLYTDTPVIIFGDHTRVIKYVDKPFFIGADGVKVLKSKIDTFNTKYLYYALLNAKIPNTGYNRHFKWLKEIKIAVASPDAQRKIVSTLSEIENIIGKRKRQLEKLDELIKSKFTEMFGEHSNSLQSWNISTLGEQFEVCSGGTPSTSESKYWENGTIPWIGSNMCQNEILLINDGKFITNEGLAHSAAKWVYKGAVLVALVGATIGKTALIKFDTATNQNIASINVPANNNFRSEFIFYQLQMQYHKFMEIGNGKFKMANLSFVRALPCVCPPIELQNQFAKFVENVEVLKSKVKQSLAQLEVLKKSLMQKYFG